MPRVGAQRSLRPRGEVRRLLLAAARELFAERGYAGTTTRAVSTRAGVTHSLLHAHFPSKAGLFEEAVLAPLAGYIEQFLEHAQARSTRARSLEQECRFFVEGLYDVLSENRRLILALIAAGVDEKDVTSPSQQHQMPFDRLLDHLDLVTEEQIRFRGLEPSMPGSSILRLTFGMVMSAAVLNHWIFRGPVPRKRVIDDIVTYMVRGISAPSLD